MISVNNIKQKPTITLFYIELLHLSEQIANIIADPKYIYMIAQ